MSSTSIPNSSNTSVSAEKMVDNQLISSPTSVVTVPLTPPAIVKSKIENISEQGTEVTLLEERLWQHQHRCFADEVDDDDDDHSSITPRVIMPSPCTERKGISRVASPETPLKIPLCGIGRVCLKQRDTLPSNKYQNACATVPVQECIVSFLGRGTSSSSWQRHFSSALNTNKETNAEIEAKSLQQALLRRRPTQIKANRAHLHHLRRDLNPSAASPKRLDLFRSTSHNVQSERKATRPRTPLKELVANEKSKKTLWETFTCHQDVTTSVMDETFLLEGNGYESDPETFGRTCLMRSPAREDTAPEPRRLFALYEIKGEDSHEETTSSVFNEKWVLVLHSNKARPQAMHVWIERGQKLAKKVVPPQLCWKRVPRKGERNLRSSPDSSIDILDVQRVLSLNSTNAETRQEYPLAKVSCSLFLKTVDATFCWQAPSAQERDHLISLWKITIARFGAALITGDDDRLDEYFTPDSATVGFQSSH